MERLSREEAQRKEDATIVGSCLCVEETRKHLETVFTKEEIEFIEFAAETIIKCPKCYYQKVEQARQEIEKYLDSKAAGSISA